VVGVSLRVAVSDEVDAATRAALRQLWAAAFGDRFDDDDADHAYGGVHVLAADGGEIAGHASAVPRRIRVADDWWDVGYVEAVATHPAAQRAGVGSAVMRRLHEEIDARWPLAFLSTGRARDFYLRIGWEVWQGPSSVLTEAGPVATDEEHGGILVRRTGSSAGLDLALPIMCEDRPGDAW
jgi:aminoglycoside 2'-N-acetyltransferase I